MSRRRTPRPVGRPPLPSTLWLRDALAQGCDPEGLYDDWRRRHFEIVRYPLVHPRRSFRAALANCEKWRRNCSA